MNEDKLAAYQTLYTCLETVSKLMAPIAPFFADQLYRDLTGSNESVHLAKFPEYDEKLIDKNLEECMQLAQQSSSMILALRRKAEKKVRQPLAKAVIPAVDAKVREQLSYIADLVRSEVNVKELQIVDAADSEIKLVKKIKPNFKVLGKKYGKQMKEIAAAVAAMNQEEISKVESCGAYELNLASGAVTLETGDVEITTEDMPGWLVANEGVLTIALDVTVTKELKQEGIARELINRIQNIRKSSGFEITDKIDVEVEKNDNVNDAVNNFGEYIASQVLARGIKVVEHVENAIELDFEEYIVKVSVRK